VKIVSTYIKSMKEEEQNVLKEIRDEWQQQNGVLKEESRSVQIKNQGQTVMMLIFVTEQSKLSLIYWTCEP